MQDQTYVVLSCFRRRGDMEPNLVHKQHHFSNPGNKLSPEHLPKQSLSPWKWMWEFQPAVCAREVPRNCDQLLRASPHCGVIEWEIGAMRIWGVEDEKLCEGGTDRDPSRPGQIQSCYCNQRGKQTNPHTSIPRLQPNSKRNRDWEKIKDLKTRTL